MQIPQEILDNVARYKGSIPFIERAIGAYVIGQIYGWRALYMGHSQSTLRSYERTLGISFTASCPERTNLSSRVLGVRIADKLGSFWKVVRGSSYSSKRGLIDDDGQQGSLL